MPSDPLTILLSILLLLPLFGAIGCALSPNPAAARNLALAVSIAAIAVFFPLAWRFNYAQADAQFGNVLFNFETIGFSIHLGLDSVSLVLVALTVFLQPLVVAASFQSIQDRPKEYYAWMMLLQMAMLGVFLARDALLFYVFFELTLVPMFFIIGIWGGPQRRVAAGRFFLFTFAGSVFTLAALLYLVTRNAQIQGGQFNFEIDQLLTFARTHLTRSEKLWITLGLLAGFAVKVPLFPVHTWLPLAHTEAPTAGSVVLAGVLLKLGTYGIYRLALPIGFIDGNAKVLFPLLIQCIGLVCVIGIIYGALVAWVQQDIKKLVAYSSVSHLGFCVLGMAALNHEGVQGSVLYMINHGLSTGAMFLVIGMIYDRYHTRDINELSGLARKMPVMAFFFVLFTLSSIGLPGLNGFVSEFLTILGAFKSTAFGTTSGGVSIGIIYGSLAALGIILGAVYMLHMTARVIFGPLKTPGHDDHEPKPVVPLDAPRPLPRDLSAREIGILIPIALAVIVLGVIPAPVLRALEPAVSEAVDPSRLTPPPSATVPIAPPPGGMSIRGR